MLELPRKEKKKGAESPPVAPIVSPSHMTAILINNEAKHWQGN